MPFSECVPLETLLLSPSEAALCLRFVPPEPPVEATAAFALGPAAAFALPPCAWTCDNCIRFLSISSAALAAASAASLSAYKATQSKWRQVSGGVSY